MPPADPTSAQPLDYNTPVPDALTAPGSVIFRRLLRMLRPHWGMAAGGMVLLVLAMPCELFPALVWKYVTDDLILTGHSRPTPVLPQLFSLGGHFTTKLQLLAS